jgi:hypothetical protein
MLYNSILTRIQQCCITSARTRKPADITQICVSAFKNELPRVRASMNLSAVRFQA